MKRVRYKEIDDLRGFAMFGIIFIHAAVSFPQSKIASFFWDMFQFAVPVFLFCSFYIYFKKEPSVAGDRIVSYVVKRLKRLLLPYYIFLLFYIPLVYFYSPGALGLAEIVRLVTLTTAGNDVSWLVLLFAMFSLIVPIIALLQKRMRPLFILYGLLSLGTSIFLLYSPSLYNFKLVMWLPWSVIAYFTYYFVQKEGKALSGLFWASSFLFGFSTWALMQANAPTLQYANKYPPNLYHLSYGMVAILALYFLSKKGAFKITGVRQLTSYLNAHSYSIYFIHFLVLNIMTTYFKSFFFSMQWWQFFAVLFISSVSVQILMGSLRKVWARRNHV